MVDYLESTLFHMCVSLPAACAAGLHVTTAHLQAMQLTLLPLYNFTLLITQGWAVYDVPSTQLQPTSSLVCSMS